tara:strand:+ start:227 stop:568 length:342 start_codon:yes stop_codon:yes gene_type:complete
MKKLLERTCSACEIGAPLVPHEEQALLLKDLKGWRIDNKDISKLVKCFKFDNYNQSIEFSNKIAELADLEDHHPKITIEWGIVELEWWSHKIKGLHMNDFICAAKSEYLYESN